MNKILFYFLILSSSYAFSAELKFSDTLVKSTVQKFTFLAGAGQFVSTEDGQNVVITHQVPPSLAVAASVERVWEQNLKVIGVTPKKDSCKKIEKLRFVCHQSDGKTDLSMSWSRNDLIVAHVKGGTIKDNMIAFSQINNTSKK